MSKWKGYHREKKNGYSKEEEKKGAPGSEDLKKLDDADSINLEAAAKAARQAMAFGQIQEINEAVGAARAKGISTEGKVVGTNAAMASIASGVGFSGPDIGVENLIEADENNPNREADYHELSSEMGQGSGSSSDSDNSSSNSSENNDSVAQERKEEPVPVLTLDDDFCL